MGHRRQKLAVCDLVAASLSVITVSTYRRPLSSLRKNRLGCFGVSPRLHQMSSTLPCWSTARHR